MRKIFPSITLTALLFVGAGCISFGTSGQTQTGADGGLFKTTNKGDAWVQKTAIATATAEKKSASGVNVTTIVQDATDPNALYIGTTDNGMFFTYDGGESWQQPTQLTRGRIPSLAVHPKQKCTIYVAIENKLLKSDDCSRTWSVVYLDSRVDKQTTVVALDATNSQTVWIANNSGDVLRSTDGGASWVSVKSFANPVLRLALHNSDNRRMFVATKSAGVWRSDDAGTTWKDLRPNYAKFSGANDFYDMALGVSDPNTMMIATKFGLLRSADSGATWQDLHLLTPPGTALIYSIAIDPKDVNMIYYGTSTTFYRSSNGGVNWVPKKLPGSRTATVLTVDRNNSSVVYLGVTKFK